MSGYIYVIYTYNKCRGDGVENDRRRHIRRVNEREKNARSQFSSPVYNIIFVREYVCVGVLCNISLPTNRPPSNTVTPPADLEIPCFVKFPNLVSFSISGRIRFGIRVTRDISALTCSGNFRRESPPDESREPNNPVRTTVIIVCRR